MAYVDQRTGGNQRAAIVTTVALIQGAVIIALINGLAVRFIKPPPEPPMPTKDIPVTVTLPPSPPPPPDTTLKPLPNPILVPPQVPVSTQPVRDPVPTLPVPLPAEPTPIATFDPPAPSPSATATPRLAKPRNTPANWATSNDYPARDLREGNQGVTRFTLAIDATGRVTGCTIIKSSGHPGLDKAACDNVSRRARFDPATDSSGSRVAGSYTSSIVWQIPRD